MKLDGTKLKSGRLAKGWNQTQVAKKSKLTTTTICKAENEKEIYPATAKRICDVLEIPLAEVMLPIEKEGDGDAA